VHPLWFYKHQYDNRVRSTQNAFSLPFAAILVNCAPRGEMHNYCTPHIIKENCENFLVHLCNYKRWKNYRASWVEKCFSYFILQFYNPNETFIHELRCESTPTAAAAMVRSPISVHNFRSEKRVFENVKIRLVVIRMFFAQLLCRSKGTSLYDCGISWTECPSSWPQIHENG
jgi:hypothetical protein